MVTQSTDLELADKATAEILNIAAYKFVAIDDTSSLRQLLKDWTAVCHLKGTILLATEGINMFLAGKPEEVHSFLDRLRLDDRFGDLAVKESWSNEQPFSRMLVRLKKEIIAFGIDSVQPAKQRGRKISPETLRRWIDEGRDITLLDTRNTYEVELGTFDNAVSIPLQHFREFPERVGELPTESRDKPMVMFCTGGIRCEKAGPFLEQAGFSEVYQLDGGILKYFEDVGAQHYRGDCFVFDNRVTVKPDLSPSGAILCYACQKVLTSEEIASPKYKSGEHCPSCYKPDLEVKQADIAKKQSQLDLLAENLPGSVPYTNIRPIHIPRHLAGKSLSECLQSIFPQCDKDYWKHELASGLLRSPFGSERILSLELRMREGERIDHLHLDCVEPEVSANIQIVDHDEGIIVVSKPAGLASHASGRFCRNTLEYLVGQAYLPEKIRLAHRLDSNTSGLMILAKRYNIAKVLQMQFAEGEVSKTYLARVHGHPTANRFECQAPIARDCEAGGIRRVDSVNGLPARTEFEVIERYDDETSLVYAYPITGRTNQIRCHLWHLGFPIVNDVAYKKDRQLSANITSGVGDPVMCLHALEIKLTHPFDGRQRQWTDALPVWAASKAMEA